MTRLKTYSATIPVHGEITPEIQVLAGKQLTTEEIWELLVAQAIQDQETIPWMMFDGSEYPNKDELIKEE